MLTEPPLFAEIMQDAFGRAVREAGARAQLAGVPLAGERSDPASVTVAAAPVGKKPPGAKSTPKSKPPTNVHAIRSTRARKKR